jgi:hypothetical protein
MNNNTKATYHQLGGKTSKKPLRKENSKHGFRGVLFTRLGDRITKR